MRFGKLFVLLALLPALHAGAQVPQLTVTTVSVVEPSPAVVPVVLTTNGAGVSAVSFSLDFDETCLTLDPADAVVSVPPDFTVFVAVDAADTDGEVDISIADIEPPIATLSDGAVATLTFGTCAAPPSTTVDAAISFAAPAASFGGPAGLDVGGTTVGPRVRAALLALQGDDVPLPGLGSR